MRGERRWKGRKNRKERGQKGMANQKYRKMAERRSLAPRFIIPIYSVALVYPTIGGSSAAAEGRS